jgi:spermidine/putrescine-binding protein
MGQSTIGRRAFLRGTTGTLAGASLGRLRPAQAQAKPKQLTMSNWGGEYGTFVKENVDVDYTKRFGVSVVHDPSADNAARITKVKLSAPGTYDLIHLADSFFARAVDEGILEPLNYRSPNFTNAAAVDPAALTPFWPRATYNGMGVAYNPNMVKEPPTSWADLWKPEYKGKIVVPGVNHSFGLYVIFFGALAAGKDWKDVDTGLEMLKRLADLRPVWSMDTPSIQKLFHREEVAIGWLGKAETLHAQTWGAKTQFTIPKEGGIFVQWGWGIVKGTRNLEWAERYVNLGLDPEVQARYATKWRYAGSNPKWVQHVDPDTRKQVEWTPEETKRLIGLDHSWITSRRVELTERWNKIVSG